MYNIELSPHYKRQFKKISHKADTEVINKIKLTVEAIEIQKFTRKINPHPIYWNQGKRKVIDIHADYDLIILYTIKGTNIILEAIGTHKELGISESFNNDDIIDDFLLEMI